jgi:hypothetical protein
MTMPSQFPHLGQKPPANTPLLTLGDVDRWNDERQALIQQRSEIDLKIAELDKKLASAEPFIRELATSTVKRQETEAAYPAKTRMAEDEPPRRGRRGGPRLDNNLNATKVLGDIALRLARRDGYLESWEVWDAMQADPNVDPHIKGMDRNYVYVVMRRLADQGLLVKDGNRYVLAESVNRTEDAAPNGPAVAGFKLVPLTKEERIKEEAKKYLARRPNKTAHRAQIAAFLVERGIMGQEKNPIKALAVYFVRWP